MYYQLGKKMAIVGFVTEALAYLLFTLNAIFDIIYWLCEDWEFYIDPGFVLYSIPHISTALIAVGLLVMWLAQRDRLDFLTGAVLGVSSFFNLVILWLSYNGWYYYYLYEYRMLFSAFRFLMQCLSAVIFLYLAFKMRGKNQMFTLLLLCAFAYMAFSPMIWTVLADFTGRLTVLVVLENLGSIFCAFLGMMAIKAEN